MCDETSFGKQGIERIVEQTQSSQLLCTSAISTAGGEAPPRAPDEGGAVVECSGASNVPHSRLSGQLAGVLEIELVQRLDVVAGESDGDE